MLSLRPAGAFLAALAALVAAGCRAPRDSSAAAPSAPSPSPPAPSAAFAAYPWVPDLGDGTYRNPVIYADYSDPDAIRVGDAYFLIASSFHATPGLPVLRSRDLVNWTLVGHALENLPSPRYDEVQPGAGVWAPSLREHAGTFYIFAPLPDEGIYVLTAQNPEGPWSEPRMLLEGKGLIDPCPLWDDDGKAYLVHAYARSRAGIKDRLRVLPMSPDATRVLGEGTVVFHDPARHPTLEGPKFYKRHGWYYILAPAGGVPRGWQVALRSKNVFGPYEDRIVLEQGATSINGPHQGALIDTPSGQWWFLHFQDAGLYGRVVHLNPVVWEDDWPLMGTPSPATGKREPVLVYAKPAAAPGSTLVPATGDEFDDVRLGLQWQWNANHRDAWYSLCARPGYLRLFAQPATDDLGRASNLLLQKLPARSFVVETVVELADGGHARAGLTVAGESHAALAVEDRAGARAVTFLVDNRSLAANAVAAGPVRLSVEMADGGACRFFFQGASDAAPRLAGSFQARAGRWIGARIGVFAIADSGAAPNDAADFDYFRFRAPPR